MDQVKLFISFLLMWFCSHQATASSTCGSESDSCCRSQVQSVISGLINQQSTELKSILEPAFDSWQQELLQNGSSQLQKPSNPWAASRRQELTASGSVPAHEGVISSCSELPHTDQALLQPEGFVVPFWALCVQQHHLVGDGWLVILQRVDTAAGFDFRQNWIAYREGFGSLDGSFWLGLEKIHLLTTTARHELMVELVDFGGDSKYARYTRFAVGDESSKYVLDQLGSYSGTAGDGLRAHLSLKFSTYDDDNDGASTNCPIKYIGGWWYNRCYEGSHLTGNFTQKVEYQGIVWKPFSKPWKTLRYARMMIRKLI